MGDVDDANRSRDAPNAELGALDTELGTTRHLLGSHESLQASELNVTEPEVTQSGVTQHRLPSKPPSSVIGNGRFQLGEVLGSGGMGLVYSAFDRELSRSVAIKFLHQSHKLTGTVQLELLRGEARAVARLNHPNIVHVYDLGVADGQPYLVMELVTGEQLQAILDRGPLSFGEAMQ